MKLMACICGTYGVYISIYYVLNTWHSSFLSRLWVLSITTTSHEKTIAQYAGGIGDFIVVDKNNHGRF